GVNFLFPLICYLYHRFLSAVYVPPKNILMARNVTRYDFLVTTHQTVHAGFPHTSFVWHCPIAGDGLIN
ncbi:MAG: hypothetical protein EAX96_21380, partial [Candidatus Lokiarchaeota archaeon]|nr:hypothetical protein [Candidatus Lokiarchaeota archaeon]